MAEPKKKSWTKRVFWGWVAVEIAVTGWIGWEIARATEKPWARQPKPKVPKLPGAR